jgi:hypothetical protein
MSSESFPPFLESYGAFHDHLMNEIEGDSNVDKGEKFLSLALKVLPLCDEWNGFAIPEPNEKKSHDSGVDFTAEHENNETIAAGQSKLHIKSTKEIDSIISKFRDFASGHLYDDKGQMELPVDKNVEGANFFVITLSKIDNLVKKYSDKSLSSSNFYSNLKKGGRIDFIHGPDIVRSLRSYYRKTFDVPQSVKLNFDEEFVESNEVYLSVVSSKKIRSIYSKHGSSIFFENIRDFVGIDGDPKEGEEGVNYEIMKTLSEEPEMMLSRNNGITFKAESVEVIGDTEVILKKAGIVNGCQTTMCMVKAGDAGKGAQVPVKVVTSAESWDVAKSANYQNKVNRIDLDLARYLRPQLVQQVASNVGYSIAVESKDTVSDILNEIHGQEIRYEEVRSIFIGMFSRTPNNLFRTNYNKLRVGLLDSLKSENKHIRVLETILKLAKNANEASDSVRDTYEDPAYSDLSERFMKKSKVKYRSFFALLSICACIGKDISSFTEEDNNFFENYVEEIEEVLITEPETFNRVYSLSFKLVSQMILQHSSNGDSHIKQIISSKVRDSDFKSLYRSLRLEMDSDPVLS